MGRKTRTDEQRRQASREADRLAGQADNLARRIQASYGAETEEAVAEAEAFDGRNLWTGQAIPGRPIQVSSPLDNLRRAAEEADAIADKMADRVKHAGANVRATALSNVAWAERDAQEARERWWEADGLARDYGGSSFCADPDAPSSETKPPRAATAPTASCTPRPRATTGTRRTSRSASGFPRANAQAYPTFGSTTFGTSTFR